MKRSSRLALVLCLALLAVGLGLRARLPRPTNAGEAWLWEQAETLPTLEVTLLDEGKRQWPGLPLRQGENVLRVTDRAGIRALLRAWQTAGNFDTRAPLANSHHMTTLLNKNDGSLVCLANLHLVRPGGNQWLTLYREANHWGVWRSNDSACAPLRTRCLLHIGATLRAATDKAQGHQPGYGLLALTSGATGHTSLLRAPRPALQ